jgi:hypothetical protein
MARKNPFLVRAHQEFEYTQEMLDELAKCETDPLYFIEKYVMIRHPTRGAIPFEPYEYQKEMVRTIHANQQTITTLSRQSGKSTIVSAYVLWFVSFNEHKDVLVVSNKNSNAMEIVRRITFAYEQLPAWLKPPIDETSWNKHELSFKNGCRVVSEATSESSGRGLSIALALVDELAFVDPSIAEEFWASLSPTLSTGGKAAIISTPNGDSNLFATLYRGAENNLNGMVPLFFDWTHVPHLTQEYLDKEEAKFGPLKVRQEYHCEFLSSEELLVDSIVLGNITAAMRAIPVQDSTDQLVFFEQPMLTGATYMVGIDPSKGTGGDYHGIQVLRLTDQGNVVQAAEYRSNKVRTPQLYTMIKRLIKQLNGPQGGNQVYFAFENNAVGEGISALYQNDPDIMSLGGAFMVREGREPGMTTSGKTKIRACLILKDLLETGKLELRSHTLLRELKQYVRSRGSYAAQHGGTDDLISAMLICTRILKDHVSNYDMNAFHAVHSYDEEFGENDLVFLPSML